MNTGTYLSEAAGRLAQREQSTLDAQKAKHSELKRADFLWHYLLQSFATMGRASGWVGLMGNRTNYDALRYEALAAIPTERRLATVREVCWRAKVRMPDTKADYICGCWERIHSLGGPKAARDQLLALPGREAKIHFLKSFPGIGDKYSRNLLMDVYHEDFRDSIAIDARIKGVSAAHGLVFKSYTEHEQFWLDIAKQAGLNGWELDRLLFNFTDEFKPAKPIQQESNGVILPEPTKQAVTRTKQTAVARPGYEQIKIKVCRQFPFAGLDALGMWYGTVVSSEKLRWESAARSARLGPVVERVALCLRDDGFQLRKIRTDGTLLEVYDWKSGELRSDSLLPASLLGDNLEIIAPADVPARLLALGGFRCEFSVNGLKHRGWLLRGKSYSAAWTETEQALHFEEDGARCPNGHLLRVLDTHSSK
jgi:hypothetical protein